MTSTKSWKQFQLFDITPIRDPNYGSDKPLYSNPTLSAICSDKDYMFLAINDCWLRIVSKAFEELVTIKAYDDDYKIGFMKSMGNTGLVMTIAEKQGSPSIVKVWEAGKFVKREHHKKEEEEETKHSYHSQVILHDGNNSYPISCFQVSEDLTCIAVGYTNGIVLLIRGDLIRDRGTRQRVVYDASEPITGVEFNDANEIVFVTTTSKILTVPMNGRNHGRPKKIFTQQNGVALGCVSVDKSQQLITATQDGFRYYSPVGKSHVLNFNMSKKLIYQFGENYIFLVSQSDDNGSPSMTDITKTGNILTSLIVLDLRNMHVSCKFSISNIGIRAVFPMWDDLYVLANDGVLYKIHEKPKNQQIELVLQRNIYSVAYDMAIQSKLPNQMLLRIRRLEADYFYNKHEYEKAAEAYTKCLYLFDDSTIGKEEKPSEFGEFVLNVITKFKDVTNIKNLIKFLQNLYEAGFAQGDHLTLLLCCYCKLKMTEELDAFIAGIDFSDPENVKCGYSRISLGDLNIQLLINLFKECGYFSQVLTLLKKLNQPGLIVDVQLNDLHQASQCLRYIRTLAIEDLLLILIEHSKTLLDEIPVEATELLIEVFTGNYKPLGDAANLDLDALSEHKNHESSAFNFNSYKSFLAYLTWSSSEQGKSYELMQNNEPTYLPPKPSLIFSSFVDKPNVFVIFLEACIDTFDKYQGNINDKKELLITLLDVYLSLENQEHDLREEWHSRAITLVQTYGDFLDNATLLLISHLYSFTEGEVAARVDLSTQESLFKVYQEAGDFQGCLKILYESGDDFPGLYKQALKDMIFWGKLTQLDKKDLNFLLSKLLHLKLATPCEIVRLLGSTSEATIGLVKEFLITCLDTYNQEISNSNSLSKAYAKESSRYSDLLSSLTTEPFVIQNNKCSYCNQELEFPIVHFKCKHSFHQRCLLENTSSVVHESGNGMHFKCPLCSPLMSSLESSTESRIAAKDDWQMFSQDLAESNDRFKVMIDYIGKGVMQDDYFVLHSP